MAQFEGTIKEFTKFIGGYTRNTVQYISRNHRKKTKKCQHCGSRTTKLDAAHIAENDRPTIISKILGMDKYYKEGIVKIDLQEFEKLFIAAHTPIENAIIMLCRDCHLKYDHVDKIIDQDIKNDDTEENEESDLSVIIEEESELIEDLILNANMNKAFALDLASKSFPNQINLKNLIYSNQNKTKDNWWLEPSLEKFKSDLFMILNKPKQNKLLVFKIPKDTITNPEVIFFQRTDKNAAKFLIPISDTVYLDAKGFDFTPYLVKELSY